MKLFSSDRLSPILVKELRQGIRSKLFLGAFLTVQVLLFLYGTTLLMSDGFRGDSDMGRALFWTALVLPMLVLVPAMASQGIEKEISGKTLDLLLLTRISSYRLVLGKWASVIVQSTLLVTSALPYLTLRYFLGGMDIWSELVSFALLLLASALLAGITMGFWATKLNKLIKGAAVLGFVWFGPYMLAVLFASRHGLGGMGANVGPVLWLYAFIATLMMLALAASRIGSPAENHSTPIRALALVTVGAALAIRGTREVEVLSAVLAVVILGPALVGALTESLRPVPRLYAPFVRRSGLSRWLAFPLSPGWPGGVAFTGVVLALAPWFSVWAGEFRFDVLVAVLATFLFPAALVRTLRRPERRSLGLYLLAQLLLTAPIYVWGAAKAFDNTSVTFAIECVAGVFPPVALMLELGQPSGYVGTAATIEGLVIVLWSTMALVRAGRREWRAMVTLARPQTSSAMPRDEGRTAAAVVQGSLS
jgi:hypothetical protein